MERVLLLITVLLSTSSVVFGRTIVNSSNYVIELSSEEQYYVVEGLVDLKGSVISLHQDCILSFAKDGKIVNGQIVGNNTTLRSLRSGSLGVVLSGTWILPRIDDSVFDHKYLTDTEILDNISALQSDKMKNTIILQKPFYSIEFSEQHKRGLVLKSNAVLKNSSTIGVKGNDLISYSVIMVGDVSNVRIYGGSIMGDVGAHQYREGTTSEWGFGISISRSHDVVVDGVSISKCTGDGIYIGGGVGSFFGDYSNACKNILIRNVSSIENRRQAVSITYADGVIIKNCVLSNTGLIELTNPGCGLDIEPNEGQAVRNVSVLRCKFYKNGTLMDVSVGGYSTEGNNCNVEKILFQNCSIEGELSLRTGSAVLKHCSMRTLSLHLAKMPKEKVLIDHCLISGGSGVVVRSTGRTTDYDFVSEYRFKSCSFDMKEALTPAMFSSINHNGNEVAAFIVENSSFTFPEGTQRFDMVQPKITCSFNFLKCQIDSKKHSVEDGNVVYENCRIKQR